MKRFGQLKEIGSSLEVRYERRPEGGARVSLYGELDMSSAEALARDVIEIESGPEAESLIVDLTGLRYVDSSGLDALLEIARCADRRHVSLSMQRGHASLHRVFELTGFDRILPFTDELGPAGVPTLA